MKVKVPAHLKKPTAEWFERVIADYELEAHHIRLLTLAAEAWDRCVEARLAIAQHGMTYQDRFGTPRVRPEVAIERDSRIAFARLLRELALDVDEPGTNPPPTIAGNAGLRR
jgi:phage terminase small subunit